MEYLILEEKYKNLLNKSNYENTLLKKETEILNKKLENLESAYINNENKITAFIKDKEELEDYLYKIKRENLDLKDEISKLNEKIQDLKGLTKTYRKMIKNRNKELFESEILMAENINLRNNIQAVNNEKLNLESELNKKKKIINVIKDKYKKNIGRLLEKFNQKDRHIYEFQSFIIDELNNLKKVILRENENMHFDETLINNKFMNISFHLDILTKKLEEKMTISIIE
ncbi:conserved Plasmodium protein, unknown function [Plasmodium sp. gorilla clade G2]|uniref:conserved Plasmodium protein, unknown function n=1 Tax=Plasmodium sp. gorilla clade G2 TaxID=880535 RepID=UPI000D2200A1|nr:conserved Plasmodium protein, unknown function [Plasmodium sp. gorilla clade G2]SOV17643.1 conserved Plasmodium protein, unknown function [Plasmodium sp. gorilla clade G2]